MNTDIKGKIDTACRTAEEFTKLYYESLDKKRHQIAKLYLDDATLSWNGNGVQSKDAIQKFFMELPSSVHSTVTLDAQPIMDNAVSTQTTILIQVAGTVKFSSNGAKPFQQTFVITTHDNKWKVVSDCFRLQDAIFDKK